MFDLCDDPRVDGLASGARRSLLVVSLTVVAADASEQLAWVDRYWMSTDEIALDFEHAFRVASGAADAELDREVLADLKAIDAIFDGMSGQDHADCWTGKAVASDPRWSEARDLARRALVVLVGDWRLPMPELREMQ
ncbi:hypothetical protein [Streptomyces sp. NPDC055189]